MANQTYTVRRAGVQLGSFSVREISALFAKGKLQATDEVGLVGGVWQTIEIFLKSIPQQQAPVAASPAMPARQSGYFVTFKGQRHGPLELSKIKAMVEANLLDSSAQLENAASPGQLLNISSVIPIVPPPLPTQAGVSAASPQVAVANPATAPAVSSPVKPKVSYLNLWWKTTLWIYLIMAVLGFLTNNLAGLAIALGAGLLLAPLKGAFWAWIIWLIRK